MSKTYTRLTEDERYQIYEGMTEKRSHCEIASEINKHHSTVLNEVKRNTGLRGQWSPDQVQGRLKSKGPSMVCATTIYAFIQKDKITGGDLHKHLRHKKPYKNRTGSPEARGQIIGNVSIDERPAIADERVRIGDWEADTVSIKGYW